MQTTPLLERWNRWARGHAGVIDGAFAAVLALFGVALYVADARSVPGLSVTLALTVPLAWRRTRPVVAGSLVALAAYAHLLVLPEVLPISAIAVPIAVYALAAYAPRWAANTALPVAVAGGALAGVRYFGYDGRTALEAFVTATFVAVFLAGAWAFGRVRGLRLREMDSLTERNRLLELERLKEAELAATQERNRIAREMHDIVAHSLTAIIAQADGGRYAAATNPEAAVGALTTIAETGRRALTDMRGLLSVLREDTPREFTTTPGIGDVPALVEQMRTSGLEVEFSVDGQSREVPEGLGLSVYRIVQESLTNVLKHAGPRARTDVRLDWRPDTLVVEIVDDGRGAAALVEARPGGQGLTGIEERVRLHGGRAVAGPRDGGGYRVRVELPAPTVSP
ncbi:histidine kinase [Rhodococcus pyridinivorans KG-16]|uniref:histidine kinase n=1 Tax=Rhodococcus pyridinivorans KG-16 TaxID=1441730 RepID=A0A0V9UMG0_9NOCA|nr:sensor histidine kinase [Rhodococcus pyridinivorans]KSZ59188.1 histidine kinase [Rhodococcus pyridinivorans KG-16]